MKASYLIEMVEEFCKENGLDITKIYQKMAEIYQDNYGMNPNYLKDQYCQENGITYMSMTDYLEVLNIVDRYVIIFNGIKNMVKNDWDLELDNL